MSTPAKAPINMMSASADPTVPTLAAGDTYYNSTAKTLRVYDGAAWVDLANDETTQTIAGDKVFQSSLKVENASDTTDNIFFDPSAGSGANKIIRALVNGGEKLNLYGNGQLNPLTLSPQGLTGSSTATRYVGGTTTGAPGSGTFVTGDWVVTQDGTIYVCTAGGSPGTWAQITATASLSYATTADLANVDHAAESAGVATTVARGDHKHDVNSATAVALTGAAGAGTSTSLALADHQHGNTITGGWVVNTVGITGNKEINLTGTGASSVAGTFSATQHIATGQTGAATSTKYAGGNTSGAPGSGTFSTGDWTVTTGGDIYICTSGGTPGTWVRVGSYLLGASNTWTSSNVFNGAITGNNTINLTGTGTHSVAGTFTATALIPSGLTGATTATRYVGGTASVAPTTGTFSTGDWVVTQGGTIYVCTAGGSPGTWAQITSASQITYATTADIANVDHAAESAGSASTVARGDHKHDVNSATAVALTGSAGAGTSTSLALADHQHGNTITGGWVVNTVGITGNKEINLTGTGSSAVAGTFSATQHIATGQTGAATSTKYAGGNTSGAPGSGTFATGDWTVTTGGDIYVCTSGGTPGTWVRVGSYLLGNANTWTSTNVFNGAVTGNNTINLTGTGASGVGGTFAATAFAPAGLTGATTATRYVGGTASIAPTTGTFSTGDWVVTQAGGIYVCTAGGSPGTWTAISGGSVTYATTADLANVDHAAEAAGSATTVARGDHKHDVNSATAIALTGSAGAGTSTSLALADHQHGVSGLVTDTGGQTIAGSKVFSSAIAVGDSNGASSLAGANFSFLGDTGTYDGSGFTYNVVSGDAKTIFGPPFATAGDTQRDALLQLSNSYWTGASASSEILTLKNTRTSTSAGGYEFRVTMGSNDRLTLTEPGALSVSSTMTGTAHVATGLTGATSASRYVGATASGSPASGTFALGDYVVAQNGKIWVCTTAGTVGSGAVFTDVGGGGSSPLTTKGDIFTYDTGNQRLAVSGTNGFVLTSDSSTATGLRWIEMEYPVTFNFPGNLAVQTGVDRFYVRGGSVILTAIRGFVASTGSAAVRVDVNKNGTTVHTTQTNRLSLTSGNSGVDLVQGGTIEVNTASGGDYYTVDIDTSGTTPAANLTVTLWFRRTAN